MKAFLLLGASLGAASLLAQNTGNIRTGGQFAQIGIQAGMAGPMAAVPGLPYSADAVTERVQTLSDGNRIIQTTTNSVARDGQGRVWRQESLAIALPGQTETPKFITIDDPVNNVHWSLDPQRKMAMKAVVTKIAAGASLPPLPPPPAQVVSAAPLPPPGPEKTWFYSSGAPGAQIMVQTLDTRREGDSANVVHTDLGTQAMEGVTAQGTRTVRTLPAGTVGNEQPLVITTETWYSPDLKLLVMSKAEDPRMGVTTYRLTNIKRAEPPASLFEVPADYTISDQPSNVMFYKDVKK